MKIDTTRYPLDILLCLGCSILLIPLALFKINDTIRILLGLAFILFIPGYMFLSFLFPQNQEYGGLDPVEKIAFSFGLSMALVSLIGILLFYSPFGLRFTPIFFTLFIIIWISGIFAIYRRKKTPEQRRFTISITLTKPKLKTKIDRIIAIILVITITIAIITAIYIAVSPKKQETSTEFYLLGLTGKTTDYPHNLTQGQPANVTIGLNNHEQKNMNYTIEIWLINQTLVYNQTSQTNETVYLEMWFMTKLQVTLPPFQENPEIIWKPQWEHLYNFTINKTGRYTLEFLLYTTPTQEYNMTENYREIAAIKIQNAYESSYIWLNIS